jgi:hypothetical protein
MSTKRGKSKIVILNRVKWTVGVEMKNVSEKSCYSAFVHDNGI